MRHPLQALQNTFLPPQKSMKCQNILRHKASLRKYTDTKTIPCILSDHNRNRPQINIKQNSRELTESLRVINMGRGGGGTTETCSTKLESQNKNQ